ncbi:MAG: hypothetical protein AAF380_01095, partial [Bacteroidota bacterium]
MNNLYKNLVILLTILSISQQPLQSAQPPKKSLLGAGALAASGLLSNAKSNNGNDQANSKEQLQKKVFTQAQQKAKDSTNENYLYAYSFGVVEVDEETLGKNWDNGNNSNYNNPSGLPGQAYNINEHTKGKSPTIAEDDQEVIEMSASGDDESDEDAFKDFNTQGKDALSTIHDTGKNGANHSLAHDMYLEQQDKHNNNDEPIISSTITLSKPGKNQNNNTVSPKKHKHKSKATHTCSQKDHTAGPSHQTSYSNNPIASQAYSQQILFQNTQNI